MKKSNLFLLVMCLLTMVLAGCGNNQSRAKSSVVDYLYSGSSEKIVQPSIPVLQLPLKVGIAFVPEQRVERSASGFWSGADVVSGGTLTSSKKAELLENVARHFRALDFVSEIEVIPTDYLTPNGGFSNLEQIRTMYGIDVIALVSYDQVQFTDEGMLSLTYWTIVGAYVISGEKNDTSTMLDTVVYDIKSKKMLFRAPGTSLIEGSATPVNLSEALRADSIKGFEEAAIKMTENLDIQLKNFQEKVKRNPEKVKVIHSTGYTGGGGGAFGLIELSTLLFSAFVKIKSSRLA